MMTYNYLQLWKIIINFHHLNLNRDQKFSLVSNASGQPFGHFVLVCFWFGQQSAVLQWVTVFSHTRKEARTEIHIHDFRKENKLKNHIFSSPEPKAHRWAYTSRAGVRPSVRVSACVCVFTL